MSINTSNMIFVFGSNLGGIHGSGAAAHARFNLGAKLGVGIGRTGQCYGIPTKGIIQQGVRTYVGHTLPLELIQGFVNDFIEYATQNPGYQFQVTAIGCGLAGLKHEDIAPMFAEAPNNCWFDSQWQQVFDEKYFGKTFNYWGTF